MSSPTCVKCGRPVPRRARRCPACGAVQDSYSASPARSPQAPQAPVAQASLDSVTPLDASFLGSPATVGKRLLALTIDIAVIALAGGIVWALASSWLLGLVVAAEVAVIFVVIQGRTGAGLGKLLLRLRVSQTASPRSPGLGRATVRSAVVAAGGLVGGVGAWVAEATAAADPTGRRRSWGDRAAGTVVVALPTAQQLDGARATTHTGSSRTVSAERRTPDELIPRVAAAPAPSVSGTLTPPAAAGGVPGAPLTSAPVSSAPASSASLTSAPAPSAHAPSAPAPSAQTPSAPAPTPQSPSSAPAEPGPLRRSRSSALPVPGFDDGDDAVVTGLLLVFDTGQRERLPVPVTATMGRAPLASAAGEHTLIVTDPDRTLSKNHARIEVTATGTWITDLGSTNGTSLLRADGTPVSIEPGARTAVDDGTRMRVGDRTFTVTRLMGDAP